MAKRSLVWIRDAAGSTEEQGDIASQGSQAIDLLWKARAGESQGTVDPIYVGATPDGSPEVQVYPDMRALAGTLPDQDLQGAIVKRVILKYGYDFALITPDLPSERDRTMSLGWYEGLLVAPWNTPAWHVSVQSAGHPGAARDAVSLDWLWWSREYVLEHNVRTYTIGTIPATEYVTYGRIDTRNSRVLSEIGESLYWIWSPSDGQTINGWVASWSVLLQLPG